MANLAESAVWTPGVYQIETSDPVLGGPSGVSNQPAKDLANRTLYLKEQLENHLDVDNVDAGTLAVIRGGTGRSGLTAGSYLVGANAAAVTLKTPTDVLADIKALGYYTSAPATNVAPVIYVVGQGLMTWAGTAYAVLSASETVKGLIKLATAAEAKALVDALLAITPATLGAVLADRGYVPRMTLAQVDALTSDQGPIIVTDMGYTIWAWTSSSFFTGYRNPRCGDIPQSFAPTPRAWEMSVTGGVWSNSDAKQRRLIALFRERGQVVASAAWLKGWGHIADLGNGDWKAPDLRDVFFRTAGTDADTANPRLPGAYQSDSVGPLVIEVLGTTALFPSQPGGGQWAINGGAGSTWSESFAKARTKSETRSASSAVLPVVLI